MQANILPFAFEESLVRVIMNDADDPLFVAKDVALALGYEWNGASRVSHVPDEWKGVTSVVTPSGTQQMLTLTEQGLYFFLGRSDKPKALSYQKWMASEVMPSIRKKGYYVHSSASARPVAPDVGEDETVIDITPTSPLLKRTASSFMERAASRTISPCLRLPQRERALAQAVMCVRDRGLPRLEDIERHYRIFCGLLAESLDMEGRALNNEELSQEGKADLIVQFMDDCCTPADGRRVNATEVYDTFKAWWHRHSGAEVPAQKLFGTIMRERFARIRRGGRNFYINLVLDHPA